MKTQVDLAIVGAGPAGLAAAALADALGLRTLLLDEQPAPGGQIYRNIETSALGAAGLFGADYEAGRALAHALRASRIEYVTGASVWQVAAGTDGVELAVSADGSARVVAARAVIIATGAYERPCPIAGWTLPGVMTAGAAQLMLKTSALAARGAVFAGSGPLLYLVVSQYLRAGVPVRAVLDTTPWGNYRRALPHLRAALGAGGYLGKGLRMLWSLRRSGVPWITGVDDVRALGAERVAAVEYARRGRWQRIDPVDTLFLHQGVVPNIHLPLAAGCAAVWDETQWCWRVRTDAFGRSSVAGVLLAGDAAGIAGAVSSVHRGRLAALAAAQDLGRALGPREQQLAAECGAALHRDGQVRPFLEALYRPAPALRVPAADGTLVCRCEEVTAGQVRAFIAQGGTDPNQLKSAHRCGMGPCQGRLCGLTVGEMIAAGRGRTVAEVGYYRIRPPVKPVALAELAALAPGSAPAVP